MLCRVDKLIEIEVVAIVLALTPPHASSRTITLTLMRTSTVTQTDQIPVQGQKLRSHICEPVQGWCSSKFLQCLTAKCGYCAKCEAPPLPSHLPLSRTHDPAEWEEHQLPSVAGMYASASQQQPLIFGSDIDVAFDCGEHAWYQASRLAHLTLRVSPLSLL
jgi:hypothetical protein